jgi:hypothetical protein
VAEGGGLLNLAGGFYDGEDSAKIRKFTPVTIASRSCPVLTDPHVS